MASNRNNQPGQSVAPASASVVDLFCGAGGLAHGFHAEGFSICAGIDLDPACKYPFEQNNASRFIQADVEALTGEQLTALFPREGPKILVGCAPCQPFSTYNQRGRGQAKYGLVEKFAELIAECQPDVVSMENVPQLLEFNSGSLIRCFRERLVKADYYLHQQVVDLTAYGLPQRRRRLVLLASKLGPIELERPTPGVRRTVYDEIASLPALKAGDKDPTDRLHRASRVSDLNLRRLQASRPGGTWRDWSPDLVARCHRQKSGQGYSAVYGRMCWDEPSPTITTLFYGFGNGRYGHPEQDRALSLREGAMLQSFPRHYEFVAPDQPVSMRTIGRLIGNAVPVTLGRCIARSVRRHLSAYQTI